MKINTTVSQDLSPKKMAESLAKATPEEFAEMWFNFHTFTDDKKLMKFAERMSQKLGSNRKKPLFRLVKLIMYFETKETLK